MSLSKKTTMSELARLAGVNVSTVSRALSDSPLVKPETKDQIRKLADELGYVVNVSARNLRKQSSETLGIVVPLESGTRESISDPFYLEMVGAVCSACAERNYDLIIHIPHGDNPVSERRLIRTGRADGLIVIGQGRRIDDLNELNDIQKRIVVWGAPLDDANYAVVGSDNVAGGRMAAEHLLELGRSRILFIGDTDLPEVGLRYQGLCEALAARSQTHTDDLVVKVDFGDQATAILRKLMAAHDQGLRYDAIFAASDSLAIFAMDALRRIGLSIPEDVAVIGYDNIGRAELAPPPLSTIDQHIAEGGKLMVDMLLDQLAGKTVESKMTPTSLVVRESTIGPGGKH
jgi:DNA-binding LacI/PurR family transcriptional regulator